jgi:hypothetical protein
MKAWWHHQLVAAVQVSLKALAGAGGLSQQQSWRFAKTESVIKLA